MESWTAREAATATSNFDTLTPEQQRNLVDFLDSHFSPSTYSDHAECRVRALRNLEMQKTLLQGAIQEFPPLIAAGDVPGTAGDLAGCAIVLTAGGDGSRLRESLQNQGMSRESLADFTKATFQLPGFPEGYGSLQANCAVIADLCRTEGRDIPVIVTTGPAGSVTARVVPAILEKFGNFGLRHIRIVAQDERLHLSAEGKMVAVLSEDGPRPASNPDETGGPFVKLSRRGAHGEPSRIEWLQSLGCAKIIALQATGLYDPSVIRGMASAGREHDCLGVGILRHRFEASDPFGSFVIVKRDGLRRLTIVEQGIRNDETMRLTDDSGTFHLPYNTGLYVFDASLLASCELPDYATPPKEILPSLARSPKIGYAITDLIACAKNGAVLAVDPVSYHNIKTVSDLPAMADVARRFGIMDLCR